MRCANIGVFALLVLAPLIYFGIGSLLNAVL